VLTIRDLKLPSDLSNHSYCNLAREVELRFGYKTEVKNENNLLIGQRKDFR
jgi:hypothetical protein